MGRTDGGLLFVPQDAALTQFAGFVRVGGDEYKVRISGVRYQADQGTPSSCLPRMVFDSARVDVEPPLAAMLAPHEPILKVRLLQASSLGGFIRELEELLAVSAAAPTLTLASTPRLPHKTAHRNNSSSLPDAAYYNRLMDELDAVGWTHLAQLSDDLRALELHTHDAGGRLHTIRVTLSREYPSVPPLCAVDAPASFHLNWPVTTSSHSKSSQSSRKKRRTTSQTPPPPGATTALVQTPTLQTIVSQFETFLNEYQSFWNVLEDIDAACCVLEPHHPSKATGRRRIALQRHVSVQVEIDPKNPRSICELKFFGSEASIAPLRERWSDHLFEWEEHRSVAQNLEILLDVELPSPKTTKTEEFALECGICYCYRLETGDESLPPSASAGGVIREAAPPVANVQTVIPDRLCENPKCNRPFHEKCLFEWLKALPTARQSFSTVFGECPYCREAISAKFAA